MQPSPGSRAALLAALLAVAATAPLAAAEVYVPVLAPLANDGSVTQTQVWVANAGTATQSSFVPVLLAENSDGTQRPAAPGATPMPPGHSFELTGLAQSGKYGLLALTLGTGATAEARVVTTTTGGAATTTRVPVISSAMAIAANGKAELVALDRDPDAGKLLDLGILNLARQAAQCQISLAGSDGVPLASPATITVQPLSLRHFHDALAMLGIGRATAVRAEVSCNQSFYPYAAIFSWPASSYLFVTPSVAATAAASTGGDPPPPASGSSIVFTRPGLVHTATVSDPKGTVNVPVDHDLRLRQLILDWEVVPGPWNMEKIPGNHALIWLYRGKFRSNTVANVNAFGPNKFTVKSAQNIDLPAGNLTAAEVGLHLEQGTRYHFHYVYDAEKATVTTVVSTAGTTLKTLTMAATANSHVLSIPSPGMICEFGHYEGQEGPEVPTYGWSYYDLRVEMVPY